MTIDKTKDKQCHVTHAMKDAGYAHKLFYIIVLCYCGSSHWRCSGLHFITFNLVSGAILKKHIDL